MTYSSAIRELFGQEVMMAQKVDPGQKREWTFENLHVSEREDPNTMIFIRYKLQAVTTPADESVYGSWFIGDLRQLTEGAKITTPVYPFMRMRIRTVTDFPYRDAVTATVFAVAVINDAGSTNTIIPKYRGLYQTGFWQNYVRAYAILSPGPGGAGVRMSTCVVPVGRSCVPAVFFAGLTNAFYPDRLTGWPA